MKISRLFFVVGFLCFYCSCQNSSSGRTGEVHEYILKKDSTGPSAILEITDNAVYDMGHISPGRKITHVFHFRNTGSKPLVISGASATCGCTVAEFPRKAVPVNQADSITAYFNSDLSGKGVMNKVITVMSNSNTSPDLLTLIGDVK